jgi:predicted transposase/invertase (TIGR01784 family)
MKENKKTQEQFIYDRTIREIFQEVPTTFVKLLTNKEAKELLETKFPKVEEKEADLVVKLEDDSIFHLEIQLADDKNMPKRMLYYALLIENKHKQFPLQTVLYLGESENKTLNLIKTEKLEYSYEVRYIKDIDCQLLIDSEDINDNILAILCSVKDVNQLLKRLSKKLNNLSEKRKEDYIRKLLFLFRLRPNLYDIITPDTKQELSMPFVIEKERDPFYKEGIEKGIEKGKLEEQKAIAISLLDILDNKTISQKVGLSLKEVEKLREENS